MAIQKPMDPLSWIQFIISIVSYIGTVLSVIALYAAFVRTLRMAPVEIRDVLGNLRQQMCEERWALKHQNRELRAKLAVVQQQREQQRQRRRRDSSHYHYHHHHRDDRGRPYYPVSRPWPPGGRRHQQRRRYGYDGSRGRGGGTLTDDESGWEYASRRNTKMLALTFSEQTLSLHYITLRDLWQQFKALERPFLVASGRRAEAIHRGDVWGETDLADEKVRADVEWHGESGSYADWSAMYKCDFTHRFIWYQSKSAVLTLADKVQRLMLLRMEREATCTRMMIKGIVEERLERSRGRNGGDGGGAGFGGGGGDGGGGGGGDGDNRDDSSFGSDDGNDSDIAVVQRPEKVHSRKRDRSIVSARGISQSRQQKRRFSASGAFYLSGARNGREQGGRQREYEVRGSPCASYGGGGGLRVVEVSSVGASCP